MYSTKPSGRYAARPVAAAPLPPPRPPPAGATAGAPASSGAPPAAAAPPRPPRPPPPPAAPAAAPPPPAPPPAPAPPPRPPPPPRAPPAPGGVIFRRVGSSLDTMYIVPFAGSTAELPQLAPPLWPGSSIVPRMLGGVNSPSFLASFNC